MDNRHYRPGLVMGLLGLGWAGCSDLAGELRANADQASGGPEQAAVGELSW